MLSTRESIQRRLARIEGQVRGLTKIVEQDRECIDVLTQVAALRAALTSVGSLVFSDHVERLVESGGGEVENVRAIRKMVDKILT